MNCDFCKEPLESGKHPLTESGCHDVTGCQLVFLLRRSGELETRLAEIIAWFDVIHSKYVVDGVPIELSEEWPSYWLRHARPLLGGANAD